MAGNRSRGGEGPTKELRLESPDAPLGLVVISGDGARVFPLPPAGEVTIGRSADADVQVDVDSLSRRHATLRLGATIHVKDLGSSNGTRVRDAAVGDQWVEVRLGEPIQLGSATVLLQRSSQPAKTQRRVWTHDYFEARLDEECRRPGATFAVLRVHSGPGAGEAPGVLSGELAADDCLALYAPGELEALVFSAGPGAAAELATRLEGLLADTRVGVACFPRDGRDGDRLLELANARLNPREPALPAMVVGAPAMKQLFEVVDRIAVGTISVLVTGETGVGKELVAAAIHQRSPRAKKTWLTLNCAAFTETLLESELFGHEKGAFTGATEAKPGLLEAAGGGSVFLDEVGELPPSTQVKLLRVLEERAVRRVGSLRTRPIDVRFICATNRDLEAEVASGRFRQDLYFRVGGVTLVVPPLRTRTEELEPLSERFIADTARQLGRRPPVLSQAALGLLKAYRWPGNVRELRNVLERAVLLCGGPSIELEHLPMDKLAALWVSAPTAAAPAADGAPVDEERQRIVDALAQCGGNQTRAAKRLGISRRTLVYRLDALHLARPQKKA